MSRHAKNKFVEAFADGDIKYFEEGAVGMDAVEYRCLGDGLYAEISATSRGREFGNRYGVTIVEQLDNGEVVPRFDLLEFVDSWKEVENYLKEVVK